MYFLLGINEPLQNIMVLAKPYLSHENLISMSMLKKGYLKFLNNLQTEVDYNEVSTAIEFITNDVDRKRISKLFHIEVKGSLNDEINMIYKKMNYALQKIKLLDNELYQLLMLSTVKIFTSGSNFYGSQTISSAIGVVAIEPSPKWTTNDFIEAIIHENTHTLLFLDECRFGHIHDEELVREVKALTAVNNLDGSLKQVIHSIIVAAEILLLRKKLLGYPEIPCLHPHTSILIENSKKSLCSLEGITDKYKNRLTFRLSSLLFKASEYISKI